jgi:uncharacterized protein (TIGR00730 family)
MGYKSNKRQVLHPQSLIKEGSIMVALRSLGVYCSASACIDDAYREEAKKLGRLMAEADVRLVYGGAEVGMMGSVSDGVMEAGGTVFGVTTKYLGKHEGIHNGLQNLRVTDDMHERKFLMFQEADAFAILPGGFGTLDEFFEVITWKQIGLHSKPIIILNYQGFWDPLKTLFNSLSEKLFIGEKDKELCHFVDFAEQVLPTIHSLPAMKIDPTQKWKKNACNIS